jgi:hypothetical protein
MIVTLTIDVIAPDDELAKTGDVYACLSTKVELPFVPFIGLELRLPTNLKFDDPREVRFGELFNQVTNPTSLFTIERITYSLASEWSPASFRLLAASAFEPTIKQFKAYIEFLCEFYNFSKFP